MSKRKSISSGEFVFSLETPNSVGTALNQEAARKRRRKDAVQAILDDPKNHEPVKPEQIIENPSPGVLSLKRKASGEDLIPLAQRKNRGGRPRTKVTKVEKKQKLKLRKNSPIKAEIPLDVWHQVFIHCPPHFLVRARSVYKSWYQALQYDSTWVQARQNHYGVDLPPPPPTITELQYADLLSGVGCQGKECTDQKARKTYWGCLRRWCDNCLKNDLVMERKAAEYSAECSRFRDCVPAIRVDSWSHYQWVGHRSPRHSYGHSVVRCAYSKLAVEHFLAEYREFAKVGSHEEPNDDEKTKWLDQKQKDAQDLTRILEKIEAWEEASRIEKAATSAQKRDQREAYFKAQALTIGVPGNDVEQLDAYKRAVKIAKAPHERCWEILKPKVIAEHADLLRVRKEKEEKQARVAERKIQYKILEESRKSRSSSQQQFVFKFVDNLMKTLRSEGTKMSDADLVPYLIRKIWIDYYDLADSEKPSGDKGEPYKLVMDDFRALWELKIAPVISALDSNARIHTAMDLKCPFGHCGLGFRYPNHPCPGLNSYCFTADENALAAINHFVERLMKHIVTYHHSQVWSSREENDPVYLVRCDEQGHEMGYHGVLYSQFPWHSAPWPRNLPLLAAHHSATEWNADTINDDYQFKEPKEGEPSNGFTIVHDAGRTMSVDHVMNRPLPPSPSRSSLQLPPIRCNHPTRSEDDDSADPTTHSSGLSLLQSSSNLNSDANIDPSLHGMPSTFDFQSFLGTER